MTDNFLILDEPRRPWLDADLLKQKFFTLSAQVHPDRVHQAGESEKIAANQRYTELNAAYNCLRDPKERLRHLLELERGASSKDLRQPPNDLVELSFEVGRLCREADGLITETAQATSSLLKVQMFERGQNQIEKLDAFRQTVATRNEQVMADLKSIDAEWILNPSGHAALLPRLEIIAARLGFFGRWIAQLQERRVRLTF